MAALDESLEQFLAAHHDKNYCADCLAQAAGSPSGQGWTPVAELIWTVSRTLPDRIVERGICARCGKTGLIFRYTGKRGEHHGLQKAVTQALGTAG